MSAEHVKTIQSIYAAFGRGDVAEILSRMTDDTRWGYNVKGSDVPWHQPVNGKAELPRFFQAFGENVELQAFEPKGFVHSDEHVIVHIHIAYKVRKTGKTVDMEQLHFWSFDGSGKVRRLAHFEDTAQVLQAWRA